MKIKIIDWKKIFRTPRFVSIRARVTIHDSSAEVLSIKQIGRPEVRYINSKRKLAFGFVTIASYMVLGAESDDAAYRSVVKDIQHDKATPIRMQDNKFELMGQRISLDANIHGTYYAEVEIVN